MQETSPTATEALAKAGETLMRGAFAEARELFEASIAQEETPEALEGLGTAAAWLDDAQAAGEARERAYRAYRKRGAVLESGRVAMTLGMMHFQFLGAPDVARGWLLRARRILEELDPTPLHGWVALGQAMIAAVYDKDPTMALDLSEEAIAVGRSHQDVHLEMMGLSQAGLAMVMAGDVREGMLLLDEAATAAVGGELTDQSVITSTCCFMLMACQRVRDYQRGVQWARKAMEYCRDWADRGSYSYCRSVGATMLIWQGKWGQGERELVETLAEVGDSKPAVRALASAGLADLRRRQGRFEDAGALLDELGADALRGAFGPEIILERAALALDRGSHQDASDLAERYLRMVPAGIPLERLDALAAHALARVRVGDIEGAGGSLAELEEVAASLGTDAVRGSAAFTHGVAAVAGGDLEDARRSLEDAVDLFERARGVQESGRARLELAGVLAELDRREAAEREARMALSSLSELGAAADAAAAEHMLRRLGSRAGPRTEGGVTLTEREVEILREIARGLSNQEIAEALFLSVRTVERHISNIYAKVGAHGKAARAAATAWAHTHGLA